MNKLILIGCLVLALVALAGAGAIVASSTVAGVAVSGGVHTGEAKLCDPVLDPQCHPDNGCSTPPC